MTPFYGWIFLASEAHLAKSPTEIFAWVEVNEAILFQVLSVELFCASRRLAVKILTFRRGFLSETWIGIRWINKKIFRFWVFFVVIFYFAREIQVFLRIPLMTTMFRSIKCCENAENGNFFIKIYKQITSFLTFFDFHVQTGFGARFAFKVGKMLAYGKPAVILHREDTWNVFMIKE